MRLTRTRIAELLERHGVEPSRALGQNFLCDPDLVDKIVRLSDVEAGDHVADFADGGLEPPEERRRVFPVARGELARAVAIVGLAA